jgi:ATP-dependent Lon protease
LEILNPEESQNFTDHYLDIKVDFSNTIFILTGKILNILYKYLNIANEVLHMLEPLRNRLEVIEIPSYIEEEKLNIG